MLNRFAYGKNHFLYPKKSNSKKWSLSTIPRKKTITFDH